MNDIHFGGATNVGRHRTSNEDHWAANTELGVYVVCDGMGGHAAGETASRLAVEAVLDSLSQQEGRGEATEERLAERAREAVLHACHVVYEAATHDPSKAGMGCTLTLLVVQDGKATMAHVGDTRLYLVRGEEVSQLSADHTMAAELFRMGVIAEDEVASHHMSSVLSRCVGSQSAVKVDSLTLDIVPGDRFVICSDGMSNYLSSPAELHALIVNKPSEEASNALIDFANEAGGADNITAVIVDCGTGTPAPSPAVLTELKVLAETPLFDDAFLAHLLRLVDAASIAHFEDGAQVVKRGDVKSSLMIPIEGALRIHASSGPPRDVVPGGVVGETTLLNPRPARASVSAVGETRVLVLSSEAIMRLVNKYPWFGIGLLENLGAHLSRRLDAALHSDGLV